MPLYNCVALSQRCLETLRATLPPGLAHEIILVDDGSTDGTRAWLDALGDGPCRALLNEHNLGYAAACNRGVAAARGEILALVNNDLEFLPGWIEPMIEGLARLPAAGIVGNIQRRVSTGEIDHAGIVIGADGKPSHLRAPPSPGAPPGYAPMPAVTGACFVVPRALYSGIGGLDEQYRNSGEDVDFCFRVRAAGRTVWTALASTVLHHVSASPGRHDHVEQNSFRLFRKWRREIERAAWRSWCETFLADARAGALPSDPQAERAAERFLAGRCQRPGRWAETQVAQNLLTEEARWEQMFPSMAAAPLHPDSRLST